MKLLNEALGKNQFQFLSNSILSSNMPWHFTKNTALKDATDSCLDYSFGHVVFDCDISNNQPDTQIFTLCYSALLSCLDKLEVQLEELYRIRIGLITNKVVRYDHRMHVDDSLRDNYIVGILYLTTNYQSPTIINDQSRLVNIDHVENSFVMFDGKLPHCSTSPTLEATRVNINYNFLVKQN